jgi:hypothetical protein
LERLIEFGVNYEIWQILTIVRVVSFVSRFLGRIKTSSDLSAGGTLLHRFIQELILKENPGPYIFVPAWKDHGNAGSGKRRR